MLRLQLQAPAADYPGERTFSIWLNGLNATDGSPAGPVSAKLCNAGYYAEAY